MKKKLKIITTFLMSSIIFNPIILNATVAGLNLGNQNNSAVVDAGSKILSVIQVVGIGVASIMLVALGIKYMVSSPSDKAEIKKHAVVYVVGAILIYAASGVISIIKAFSEGMAG